MTRTRSIRRSEMIEFDAQPIENCTSSVDDVVMDRNSDSLAEDEGGSESESSVDEVSLPKKKRRLSTVSNLDSGSEEVSVEDSDKQFESGPPPQINHESWQEFMSYLAEYEKTTHTKIVVKETTNVMKRNKTLASSVDAKKNTRINYVPADMKVYQRTYICTHSWEPRAYRSGARPKRHLRRTGCPFYLLAQAVRF